MPELNLDERVRSMHSRASVAHFPSGGRFDPSLCGRKAPRDGWEQISDELTDRLVYDRCYRCNVRYVGGQH